MLRLPERHDLSVLADWVEMNCLFARAGELSRSEIADVLRDYLVEDAQRIVEDIWAQVTWRRQKCTAYPLRANRHFLRPTCGWGEAAAYAFQLLLSRHPLYPGTALDDNRFAKLSSTFEKLSEAALTNYVPGTSFRVHALRQKPKSMGFLEAVEHIAGEIGEEFRPPASGQRRTFTKQKDMGVDVLVCGGFGDGRTGKIIVLAQCAAGQRWHKDRKGRDIPMGRWRHLLDTPCSPVPALAVPFVVPDPDWDEESRSIACYGGMLLDRLRISALCTNQALSRALLRRIQSWCRAQIKRLPFEA